MGKHKWRKWRRRVWRKLWTMPESKELDSGELRDIVWLDFPSITLFGAILGFLLSGIMQMLFSILAAPEGSMFSWGNLAGGGACFVVAFLIACILIAYIFLISSKYGRVATRFVGFSFLAAFTSFLSMALMGYELSHWVSDIFNLNFGIS